MISMGMFLVNCDNDDEDEVIEINERTGQSKVYALEAQTDAAISGTASFYENQDGSTDIELELSGTETGNLHPAHIHYNTAAEGGDIAISLEPVAGLDGRSEITIDQLDDGTPITYDELLQFDGYINVHLSAETLSVIVAQGDIGQNELTGESVEYDLSSVSDPDITGTATFEERVNGTALGTLELDGVESGTSPAHIHENTAVEGGGIVFTFNPIDASLGESRTHMEAFDNGDPLTYEGLLDYDGYVNIHKSAEELNILYAQGDIGQNALTGNSEAYDLTAVDQSGVSGTVTFEERINEETLVTISLMGTPDGGTHPAHIHEGSVAEAPGPIVIPLATVDGTTGMSAINITETGGGDAVTYNQLLEFDGYVNIHLSPDDLSVVAQGNIGANAN